MAQPAGSSSPRPAGSRLTVERRMRTEKHTSATKPSRPVLRRRHVVTRAGFTLVESMIASALLAVAVLGVSGTILSSYAHDKQSIATRDAVNAAEAMMD